MPAAPSSVGITSPRMVPGRIVERTTTRCGAPLAAMRSADLLADPLHRGGIERAVAPRRRADADEAHIGGRHRLRGRGGGAQPPALHSVADQLFHYGLDYRRVPGVYPARPSGLVGRRRPPCDRRGRGRPPTRSRRTRGQTPILSHRTSTVLAPPGTHSSTSWPRAWVAWRDAPIHIGIDG